MAGRYLAAAIAAVIAFGASTASATYTTVTVFGDGLSDNGNYYAATGNVAPPSPPYYQGRASNGPVAVEVMASSLGLPLTDYAWIGAETGLDNRNGAPLPGTLTMVQIVTASTAYSSSDLIVLWAGPNDIFANLAVPNWTPVIATAMSNLELSVNLLYSKGARTILMPNMANLGATPWGISLGSTTAAALGTLTGAFNARLASTIVSLEANFSGLDIIEFDTFGRMNAVLANPSAYGLTNVTDACYTLSPPSVCAQYLFWDDVHPTARAHELLGGAFADAIRAGSVPEPSAFALVALGLTAVFATGRRRRRR